MYIIYIYIYSVISPIRNYKSSVNTSMCWFINPNSSMTPYSSITPLFPVSKAKEELTQKVIELTKVGPGSADRSCASSQYVPWSSPQQE